MPSRIYKTWSKQRTIDVDLYMAKHLFGFSAGTAQEPGAAPYKDRRRRLGVVMRLKPDLMTTQCTVNRRCVTCLHALRD